MTASADTPNDSPDLFRVSHASNRSKDGGSTNRVGSRFQSFGINDLEMVDQTGVSWNQLAVWLIRVGGLAATRSLPARVTSSTVIARLPGGSLKGLAVVRMTSVGAEVPLTSGRPVTMSQTRWPS